MVWKGKKPKFFFENWLIAGGLIDWRWNSVVNKGMGIHEYSCITMVTNKYYGWVTCWYIMNQLVGWKYWVFDEKYFPSKCIKSRSDKQHSRWIAKKISEKIKGLKKLWMFFDNILAAEFYVVTN